MPRRAPAERTTRDDILDAALIEFGERGYRSASIDQIAGRAGVTKGAVYYYFEDKDDLARDLEASIWEHLKHEALAAFDPAAATLDNLHGCFEAYLAALQEHRAARFFLREVWALPRADAEEREDAYGLIRDIVAPGIERGELAALDAEAVARVLVGMFNEATLHIIESNEPDGTAAVVRRFLEALSPTPLEQPR